jgi:DNA-binding MarR family transcriptional regulator
MHKKEIRAFRRDLRSFSRILAQQIEVCCRSDVTPAQCHALLALEESGSLPNGELAALLQVDASTLSRTIDQLDLKGLVVRQPHPTDRRATLLELSDRGGQVATAIHESADALYRGILGEIPVDRRRDVLQRFAQLVETFSCWQAQKNGKGSL